MCVYSSAQQTPVSGEGAIIHRAGDRTRGPRPLRGPCVRAARCARRNHGPLLPSPSASSYTRVLNGRRPAEPNPAEASAALPPPDGSPEGLSRVEAAPSVRRPGAQSGHAEATSPGTGRSPGSRRLPGTDQSGRSVAGGRAGTEGHTCRRRRSAPARTCPAGTGAGSVASRVWQRRPAMLKPGRLWPGGPGSCPLPCPSGGICLLTTSSFLVNAITSASFLRWVPGKVGVRGFDLEMSLSYPSLIMG